MFWIKSLLVYVLVFVCLHIAFYAVARLTLLAAFLQFSGFALISMSSNISGIKLLEKVLCIFQTKVENLIS